MASAKPPSTSRAPDGGWGWVAVLGGFIFMMIVPSINRCFSLINTSWQHLFSASSQATSGVYSLYCVLSTVSGPVCAVLVDRFGCRASNISGGVFLTIGLLGSGLAPNLFVIYLTFGILCGLGRGLIEMGKEVCFAEWFDRNRAKATGFSAVAVGVGTIGMAPFIQICSDEYGMSGAMIIIAGIAAHTILAGLLMRAPHSWEYHPAVHVMIPDVGLDVNVANMEETDNTEMGNKNDVQNHDKQHDENATVISNQDSLTCSPTNSVPRPLHDGGGSSWCRWHVLRSSSFLTYSLMVATCTGSSSLQNSHFAGFMVSKGLSLRTSSYTISATGVMLIICRLITGIIFDVPAVRAWRKEIMGLHGVFMGASVIALALASGTVDLMVPFVIYIIAQSVFAIQYGVILSDIIDKQDYTWSLGILRLCRGFGFMIGPTVGGLLKDQTGTYDMSFLYSGSICLVPSLIFLAAMFYNWRRASTEQVATPV